MKNYKLGWGIVENSKKESECFKCSVQKGDDSIKTTKTIFIINSKGEEATGPICLSCLSQMLIVEKMKRLTKI